MRADHMVCMVFMECTPPPKSHTLTVTTPCRWHVNRQRGRREGKKREGGQLTHWQLTPSLHHTSSWHTPPLISSPSPFSSTSSVSLHPPPIHTLSSPLTWLTTTSTSLLLSLNPPLLTHTRTHIRIPNLPQCMCQCTRKRSSSSSSSLTTRVHHHQQPTSSSTCMPHMHTQAASGTCVSE